VKDFSCWSALQTFSFSPRGATGSLSQILSFGSEHNGTTSPVLLLPSSTWFRTRLQRSLLPGYTPLITRFMLHLLSFNTQHRNKLTAGSISCYHVGVTYTSFFGDRKSDRITFELGHFPEHELCSKDRWQAYVVWILWYIGSRLHTLYPGYGSLC
jgi:hypothetical protein